MSIGIGNISSQALMIDRGLYATSRAISRSLERLSTGSRLNNASDDVAGLTRATTIDAHVRGMREAVRNVNDGFGITTIAEGSLAEMTTILQQIRELAVQASSGTLSAADRENINNESRALLDEYDQIANGVEFNGIKLLNGSRSDVSLQVGDKASDTVNVGLPDARAVRVGEMGSSGYRYENTFSDTLSFLDSFTVGAAADGRTVWMCNQDLTIDGDGPIYRSTDGGKTFAQVGSYTDGYVNGLGGFDENIVFLADYMGGTLLRSTDGGATFSPVSTPVVPFESKAMAFRPDGTGVISDIGNIAYTEDYGATWTNSTGETGFPYYLCYVGDVVITVGGNGLIMRSTDEGKTFTPVTSEATSSFSGVVASRHQDAVFAYNASEVWRSTDQGMTWQRFVANGVLGGVNSLIAFSEDTYYVGTNSNSIYKTTNGGGTFEEVGHPSAADGYPVQTMLSSDDQHLVVFGTHGWEPSTIEAWRSTDDGYLYQESNGSDSLAGINLSDQFKAGYALMRLDKAIESISMFRADLGSVYNVLEHQVSYLMDQEASQSGALSDLKDVDYALETAELVKNQILQMAGISVLHQGLSNQSMMLDLLGVSQGIAAKG